MFDGVLGWPDGGFKLDGAFLIFGPFFSGGLIVDDFLAAVDFSSSGPRLDFVGGVR